MKTKVEVINPEFERFNYDLETTLLDEGYVKVSIGDEWKYWTPFRAILLESQTGSGKTSFVEDVLIQDTIKKNKIIAIFSNRIAMAIALKYRILELLNLENDYSESGLRKRWKFGNNVIISTYQQLPHIVGKIDLERVEYIVLDEIHYLLMDAPFSSITDLVLNLITTKFSKAKRLYISATMDDIRPYICKAESNYLAQTRWNMHRMLKGMNYPVESYTELQHIINENIYASDIPSPILYKMPENYKYLNMKFFHDFDPIKALIKKSPKSQKWMIFVTSKDFGEKLHSEIPDSIYIDADTKENNWEYFSQIIKRESFDAKVLICTSVFINGTNIKDEHMTNMVIFNPHLCDIKQAIGRKRITDKKKENLNVFLHIPEISTISKITSQNREILRFYNECVKTPELLTSTLIADDAKRKKIQGILFVDKNNMPQFNKLSIQKLINDTIYAENLKNLISSDSKKYCRHIAKNFSLKFKNSMCDFLIDPKQKIRDLLEKYVLLPPMNKNDFLEASDKITKLRKKLGLTVAGENLGSNRKPLGVEALNSRFNALKLNFEVVITNVGFYKFQKKQ